MGVDIIACIEHHFTPGELLDLPRRLDELAGLRSVKFSLGDDYKRQSMAAGYTGAYDMSAELLEKIWNEWETETAPVSEYVFDNQVECFIGTIDVWRNVLCVQHFPEHKYSNLEDPEKAKIILECNRIIAQLAGADKVVYFADSAFPTGVLSDKVAEGYPVEEIINYGKAVFGNPPEDLNDGMQFTFFIDNLCQDLSTLKKWSLSEQKFWKYDQEKNRYKKV